MNAFESQIYSQKQSKAKNYFESLFLPILKNQKLHLEHFLFAKHHEVVGSVDIKKFRHILIEKFQFGANCK